MVILSIPMTILLFQYCGLRLCVGETAPSNGPIVHPAGKKMSECGEVADVKNTVIAKPK